MMKVNIHLAFGGQCEEAFRFYERCFGGTIVTMLTYGDSPLAAGTPLEWHGKILHASLTFGGNTLAGVDLLPKDQATPQGFYVLLDLDDAAEAERIFHTLSENGAVRMPMQETFWACRFGVLVDRFGIPWEINCGRPA